MSARRTSQRESPHVATARTTSPALGFADLGVPAELCDVLAAGGIDAPFPIQSATLPDTLAGRDVLGRGRTGSGKTLAFGLAIVSRLAANPQRPAQGRPRAIILAPTRELVLQIDRTIAPLAKAMQMRTTTVFGGVGQGPQVDALRRGVDIVIACPGRLEDLINQRHCSLDRIQVSVLDEADHMADLGFLPGVKRLLDKVPTNAQHMLFSATLDNGVSVLVQRYLHDPITHSVDSEQSPVATMAHHVLHMADAERLPVILDLASAPGRTILFTRTKHRAKQLTRVLNSNGVAAVEMHGNLSQAARTRNLSAFSDGSVTALVATDIAARGIHVDDVALVIHADPPVEHKAYLHRSGRTARAGNDGVVVTLALPSQRGEVMTLMRKAGIRPTITTAGPGSPVLREIAPGDRRRSAHPVQLPSSSPERPGGARRQGQHAGRQSTPRPGGRPAAKSSAAPGGAGRPGRRRARGGAGGAKSQQRSH
ncbi:MAG: DEAD/DEAH box helicase [Ilumatobacteraceae bacterium]